MPQRFCYAVIVAGRKTGGCPVLVGSPMVWLTRIRAHVSPGALCLEYAAVLLHLSVREEMKEITGSLGGRPRDNWTNLP
jgi:hypothetical protein